MILKIDLKRLLGLTDSFHDEIKMLAIEEKGEKSLRNMRWLPDVIMGLKILLFQVYGQDFIQIILSSFERNMRSAKSNATSAGSFNVHYCLDVTSLIFSSP